jgi:SAM-dependent methyltransferase
LSQRCFDETFRVLKPGGTAILMVYNKYSLRQWTLWPISTGKELLRDWGILRGQAPSIEAQRFAYDGDSAGRAAPETVFFSQRQLRSMLAGFAKVTTQLQNADPITKPPLGIVGRRAWRLAMMIGWAVGLNRDYRKPFWIDRLRLLSTVGRHMGLDVYVEAKKADAAVIATPLAMSKAA